MISFADVHRHLAYDPATGILRWKISASGRQLYRSVGTNEHGYLALFVLGKRYKAHRLIWFMQTGAWPEHEIDHKNLDRSDNRWSNLRAATRNQNRQNTNLYKNNTSGVKGLHWNRNRKKWQVSVGSKYLGLFSSKEEARSVYVAHAKKHFGEFARAL